MACLTMDTINIEDRLLSLAFLDCMFSSCDHIYLLIVVIRCQPGQSRVQFPEVDSWAGANPKHPKFL